jgi:PHD/YefM family antitoxin component YafN of YafNO toxin-antitoxin module
MTAFEMNAELFRQLSIIAEDESLMKKALKALKRITAQKEAMDETEYLMSSPAMAEIIRQGQEDIKNGRGRVVKIEDLWK